MLIFLLFASWNYSIFTRPERGTKNEKIPVAARQRQDVKHLQNSRKNSFKIRHFAP
jgi:hypothetical protein